MTENNEVLILQWCVAIVSYQDRKERQSRCRCHGRVKKICSSFSESTFSEGKVSGH